MQPALFYLSLVDLSSLLQDAVGSTPMHVAAGEGHLEAIQALVRLGCSPKVTDRDGCTPLYCAAAWNRIGERLRAGGPVLGNSGLAVLG